MAKCHNYNNVANIYSCQRGGSSNITDKIKCLLYILLVVTSLMFSAFIDRCSQIYYLINYNNMKFYPVYFTILELGYNKLLNFSRLSEVSAYNAISVLMHKMQSFPIQNILSA